MTTILYDYGRSSAAYRLRITLNYMGLSYDRVVVDLLKRENRSAANLARNPQGLVPTLNIDGQELTQSLAIIEYLDETRQVGLLPRDPLEKARVRMISYAIAMEIHPVCNLSVARFATDGSGVKLTMADWMLRFIPKGLQAVEAMLQQPKTGQYCHGDVFSMADICLIPQVYNARRWGVDMAEYPVISRIVTALEELEPVVQAHPDKNR